MEEENSEKKLNDPRYTKVLEDGTLDLNRIQDSDYALVKRFIVTAFPNSSKVQRELEHTLKRTFILGRKKQKPGGSNIHTLPRTEKFPKRLSNTKLRALGILRNTKPPRCVSYSDFLHVNALWKNYVAELCKHDKDPAEIQQKLNRMDFHGAIIKVTASNCSSFQGLEGIVVKETKNTFVIVTPRNISKSEAALTIPKLETEFQVQLEQPTGSMKIAGNSFRTRPAERACKKIKTFMDFMGRKVYKSKLKYT